MTIADKMTSLNNEKNIMAGHFNDILGIAAGPSDTIKSLNTKLSAYTPSTGSPLDGEWKRPSDWPALPANIGADYDEIYLLVALWNTNKNYVAVKITTTGANYSIDYGDGQPVQNYASAATASYTIDIANFAAQPVSRRGCKYALVKISAPKGSITAIDFNVVHSAFVTPVYKLLSSNILEVNGKCSGTITALGVYGSNLSHKDLVSFRLDAVITMTSWSLIFQGTANLRDLSIDMTSATSLNSTFKGTGVEVLEINAPSVNNTCASLIYSNNNGIDPGGGVRKLILNAPGATSFNSLAYGCQALEVVELVGNTGKFVTDWNVAFKECKNLRKIIGLKFDAATNSTSAFYTNYSLTDIEYTGTVPKAIILDTCYPFTWAAIQRLFNSLPATSGGEVITLKKCIGTSDPSYSNAIAVGKGYTVTIV